MIFQIIALAVLAVFYICYYAKMFSQRKQGIQTDRLGKGKTGFVKFIEITVKIAAILMPVAEVISIIMNTSPLPLWTKISGACIAVIGVSVFIAAVVTMKNSWRAGVSESEKTELVTNGIFKYSRNPAFLGFDLVYIGVLLMFFNWVLLAVTLFAVVMFHLQIVIVEEVHLTSVFGEDYINYRKTVNRYIGRKLKNQKTDRKEMSSMKKTIIVVSATVILLALILFVPIPTGKYDDGGTSEYSALTYKIVKWNRFFITVDEQENSKADKYQNTSVYWFPDNQKDLDELWEIEMENHPDFVLE